MSRYGIDYYGLALYGPDTYVDFSSDLKATPNGYSSIYIKWTTPAGNWSKIRLVRNPYGYPVTPFDGVTLLNEFYGDGAPEYLDESGLTEGTYFYYSLFVYDINQYVWVKTGEASALSVKRFNNQERLWDYTPDVFKLATITSASITTENTQLKNFLNLFGFWLDHAQTEVDLLINRYDVQRVNAALIPLMLKQFGIQYESEIGAQQSRVLLRDAVQLQKEKGSLQGLKEYIKAFTGYSLSSPVADSALSAVEGLVVGHNLMLDYNDSSFEESLGHWTSSYPHVSLKRVGVANILNVSISSNVATIEIGTHGYRVGDFITVSECLPILNTPTAVEVSAVTSSTLSYSLASWATAPDLASRKVTAGVVAPTPLPWSEPSSPANYPNKSQALMSIKSSSTGTGGGAYKFKCGAGSPVDEGIPVVSGKPYTFSFRAGTSKLIPSPTPTTGVTAGIEWYDRFGTYLSSSTSPLSLDFGAAEVRSLNTRVSVANATAPTGATYAVPFVQLDSIYGSNNFIYYVDACQFEQSAAVTDFDEARNIHITLKANRINEIVNPHFEAPYAPWSFTGGTVVTAPLVSEPNIDIWDVVGTELTSNYATITFSKSHHLEIGESVAVVGTSSPYDGTHVISAKTTKTATFAVTNADLPYTTVAGQAFHSGSAVEVTSTASTIEVSSASSTANYMEIFYPNSSYTFSVYFKTYSGSITGHASVDWYDNSYALISSSTGSNTTASVQWNRMHVTSTAPANAAYAVANFQVTPASIGDKVLFDEALFERSAFVLDYFDGEAEGENVSLEDVFWEGGVANAGRSHYYKNRVSSIYRLKATLPEYLPAGSTFSIYLAQPNT